MPDGLDWEGFSLSGLIKVVDPANGTITIALPRGRENPEETHPKGDRPPVRIAKAQPGDSFVVAPITSFGRGHPAAPGPARARSG